MRAVVLVLLSVASAACETVAEQAPHCETSYIKGLSYEKGLYEGEVCDGIPSGNGTITYPNGTVRKGTFIDGKLHGEAVTIFGEKAKAIGNFVRGKEHGRFVISYSDGSVYESFYDLGRVIEKARTPIPFSSYSGNRNEIGQKHGFGEGVYKSGDSYIGEWKENKADGYGLYLWSDGRSFYLGENLNGFSHGYGTKFIKDYTKYVGEWFEGKEQGEGVKFYIGGDLPENMVGCMFKGEFWNGHPKGNLDCSRKDDSAFWVQVNSTKPDLTKLKDMYPNYNWESLNN